MVNKDTAALQLGIDFAPSKIENTALGEGTERAAFVTRSMNRDVGKMDLRKVRSYPTTHPKQLSPKARLTV